MYCIYKYIHHTTLCSCIPQIGSAARRSGEAESSVPKLPNKFLRLTDTQLFMLKQWANGYFINENSEDFQDNQTKSKPRKGEEIDRGVLSNALGGAFCPGAETCWIIRNPAIFSSP